MKNIKAWDLVKETLKRYGEPVDGIYPFATFTHNKSTFNVYGKYEDGDSVISLITKDNKVYRGCVANKSGYRQISIGGQVIYEHILILMCLCPEAADMLETDVENKLCVNHKTIRYEEIEKRNHRKSAKEQYTKALAGGMSEKEANELTGFLDMEELEFNSYVYDLEVVTLGDNARHGRIVHTFGLYDISISAKEAIELKDIILNNECVTDIIENYIKEKKIKRFNLA